MKLGKLLKKDRIILDLQARTKDEAIDELCQLIVRCHEVRDPDGLLKAIKSREKIESTGIGSGIGIPHGITDAVRDVVCALGISKRGVDFGSLDDKPVHLLFLIGIPKSEAREYLNLLARICRLFKEEKSRKEIMSLTSVQEVLETIMEREKTIE